MKLGSRPTCSDLQRAREEAFRLFRSGRLGPAVRLLRELAGHLPGDFDVRHLLGAALVNQGRVHDGISALQQATELNPRSPAAWVNLASAHQLAGDLSQTIAAFERALALVPGHSETHHRLCLALMAAGQGEDASTRAQSFAADHPNSDSALVTLALVLTDLRRTEEAIDAYRRALAIRPANTLALANLGFTLGMVRRYPEAATVLARLVDAHPSDWSALEKLIAARRAVCDLAGIEGYETRLVDAARRGEPGIDPLTVILITDDPTVLRQAATNQMKRFVPSPPRALSSGERYRHERIRLGYLSGDFRNHPVGHLIAPLIEAHDRKSFEVVGFSYGPDDGSAARARLVPAFDRFVDVRGSDPLAIACRMREAEIDIAIDLTVATEGGLPQILAFRPAPVQVSYLGWPGTSGASWLDWIIADGMVAPRGSEAHFLERVARLPDSYFPPSIDDIAEQPARAAAGLPESGTVLCCFNSPQKISGVLLDSWCRIALALPGSILWLRIDDEIAQANLRAAVLSRGLSVERIVFAPRTTTVAEHLGRMSIADLFLDTFPYNAHTTASDALRAGVPVVTVPGRSFASRVAASLLTAAGLPELIARSAADYEALAVSLGAEPHKLSAIKARLASARARAAAYDLQLYARHIEAAYSEMLARSGGRGPAGAIDVPRIASRA